MSLFQRFRAVLALLIAPPLTLYVSLCTIIDIILFRRSQLKAQIHPRFWGKTICKTVGVTVTIEGLENLQKEQNYIFVANHASQFDIFSFQGYFPHDFRWIAKKELFRIPIFGFAMKTTGFIAIDRSRGRAALKSLTAAAEKIAGGTSVLIFPEGTRSPDGKLHPFKSGAILLAIKSGVPVVPIGFNNTFQILPKNKLLAQSGTITIRVGKPIPTTSYKPKDKQILAEELHNRVAQLLYEEKG